VSVYPHAQTVMALSNVTVQCLVTTDPDEASSLQIHWKRAGRYLVMTELCRHRCLITTYDGTRNSTLLITDVTVADSGLYVCHAISRVDVSDATASLLVKGFSLSLSFMFIVIVTGIAIGGALGERSLSPLQKPTHLLKIVP